MKLLHFADLHLDTPFRWAGPDLARRRRQALRDALTRILDLAGEHRVDAVLCGGDLYEDERFTPDTVEFVRAAFERVHPLPIYLAPGNHDWFGPQSLYRQASWSPNVHIFTSDRLEPITLAEGLTLWGAAHLKPAGTVGFLSRFRVDRGGVHLALFHGSERSQLPFLPEGEEPHAPFDAAEVAAAGLHHAFVGHYHLPRDAPWHTYPGNPVPLTFGEEGARGVVIATVGPEGTVQRERHQVATVGLRDLAMDVTGCGSAQEVRDRAARLLAGQTGVVRLTLTGELDPRVDLRASDLADVAPWLEALTVRLGALTVAYDLDAIAAEQTVRGQFVRDVMASDLDPELRRRVIVTGLRALDGRSDLEVG
ncbi:MAG TPA: metallophosphoesterase [Candidatus Dormibacteraeota bacterium]|nr:metallophosphoesterase [Candidatus Dormibacteraeota bacterium]